MKFNDETIAKAVERRCGSKFWKKVYDGAPEGAKKRLQIAFWASNFLDEKEDLDAYRERREEIECNEMTVEDARYLAENFPADTAGKKHYAELAEELELRPLRTQEKLDAAIDGMIAAMSDYEKAMIEKTRAALRAELKDNCFFTYVDFWKAVGGDAEQALMAGDIFDHGHGIDRDEDLAFFWFRKAALCNSGEACYRLADILEDPDGDHFDFDAALFWWGEGVRRNDETVKIQLGYRLTFGEGPWEKRRNPRQGVALLKSCLNGDESGYAHYFLAKCFAEGVGVPKKNRTAALRHLRVANQKNHPNALELMLKLIEEGKEKK